MDDRKSKERLLPNRAVKYGLYDVGGYDSIEQSRAKVAALVKEGKSLDEVKAAMGVPAGAARFPSLAEVVYREQTER